MSLVFPSDFVCVCVTQTVLKLSCLSLPSAEIYRKSDTIDLSQDPSLPFIWKTQDVHIF